ncbi:F-box domain protein [Seiridium cupressi]
MASLLDCPEELLICIFDSTPRSGLRSLSLVNRRMRQSVESYLYTNVEFLWENAYEPTPIPLFLRTIIRRPELGNRVRSLALRGTALYPPPHERSLPWEGESPPKVIIDEAVNQELIAAVKGTYVSFKYLWIWGLRSRTMDAFVALLLSRLPNLEKFYYGPNFAGDTQLTGMMLRAALCDNSRQQFKQELPEFVRLEEVTWCGAVDPCFRNRPVNTRDALSIFYLPNVKRVEAHIAEPISFSWPAGAPDPLHLTSLDSTHVPESLLEELLKVTRGLKSLRWRWYHTDTGPESSLNEEPIHEDITINLDRFMMAIYHVRNTLTELTIYGGEDTGDEAMSDNRPDLSIQGSLRGIVQFDKLVKFEVPVSLLMSPFEEVHSDIQIEGVLPPNVEVLHIKDDSEYYPTEWDGESLFPLIESWLRSGHWKQVNPHLKGFSMAIASQSPAGGWSPFLSQSVEQMCKDAGIRYDFAKYDWEFGS